MRESGRRVWKMKSGTRRNLQPVLLLAQKVSGRIFTDKLRSNVRSRLAELENAVASYEKCLPARQLQLDKLPVPVELMGAPKLSAVLEARIAVNNNSPRLL